MAYKRWSDTHTCKYGFKGIKCKKNATHVLHIDNETELCDTELPMHACDKHAKEINSAMEHDV